MCSGSGSRFELVKGYWCSRFRLVFDVWCYYYILYIIIHILLYLILYSSLQIYSSLSSIPIFCSPLSFFPLSPQSFLSHQPHSFYTCRYLHNLIYILSFRYLIQEYLTPHKLTEWMVEVCGAYLCIGSWLVFVR